MFEIINMFIEKRQIMIDEYGFPLLHEMLQRDFRQDVIAGVFSSILGKALFSL